MFKKSLFALAALALMGGAAQAQTKVPTTPGSAPAAPVAAPAPANLPAANAVNPFVGKTLSFEARQRELEESKMQTALLEENLKQAALAEDMKVLPMKKQVEIAQATTARMKEELLQKDANSAMKGAPKLPPGAAGTSAEPVKAKPKAPARPAKKVKVAPPETPAAPAAAPAPAKGPNIELSSVMTIGSSRSVVLLVDGNILTLKNGDSSPFGTVTVIDENNAKVGDKQYHVHGATLARVTISDPKPVDPKLAGAAPAPVTPAPAAGQTVTPAPATFPGTVLPGPAQKTSGAPPLPPLQLPSGVTILPPTAR